MKHHVMKRERQNQYRRHLAILNRISESPKGYLTVPDLCRGVKSSLKKGIQHDVHEMLNGGVLKRVVPTRKKHTGAHRYRITPHGFRYALSISDKLLGIGKHGDSATAQDYMNYLRERGYDAQNGSPDTYLRWLKEESV